MHRVTRSNASIPLPRYPIQSTINPPPLKKAFIQKRKSTAADALQSHRMARSHDLIETPGLVLAMVVDMSLSFNLCLRDRVTLVGAGVASAGASFRRAGLGILPTTARTDAADNFVGAGGDDGPIVIWVGIRCAGDGREKWVGRVAVPAGGQAHFRSMYSPSTDWSDAGVSVLLVACGAGYVPEVCTVTCHGPLDDIFAGEAVRVAGDITDVVAGPLADGVGFEDCSGVFGRVGLFANAYLSVPLPYLHAAFGRAVATWHYIAVTIGFVEGYFISRPVDDSIGGRSLVQAIGLLIGEQLGCGRQEEEGRVYGSHFGVVLCFEGFGDF